MKSILFLKFVGLLLMVNIVTFVTGCGGDTKKPDSNTTNPAKKSKEDNQKKEITLEMVGEILKIVGPATGKGIPPKEAHQEIANELNEAIESGELKADPFTVENIAEAIINNQNNKN
tara:strand:- start:997 stop:1347 length:351 start_codon:yes stop_codon:yes gene_type:complete